MRSKQNAPVDEQKTTPNHKLWQRYREGKDIVKMSCKTENVPIEIIAVMSKKANQGMK